MNTKKEHYEKLMDKMEQAHSLEFYLETSWIAYSILEDRLLSALMQTGGATYSNGNDIRMLGQKIVELKDRKNNDQLLAAYFDDNLIDEIKEWKDSRDSLMHAMANSSKSILELDKETYLLSSNSKALVKNICNASRLLKKNRTKA